MSDEFPEPPKAEEKELPPLRVVPVQIAQRALARARSHAFWDGLLAGMALALVLPLAVDAVADLLTGPREED